LPALALLGVVMLTVLSGASGGEASAAGAHRAVAADLWRAGRRDLWQRLPGAGERLPCKGCGCWRWAEPPCCFIFTIRTSFTLNFINYDMATEFLVYAHAGPDVKRALAELDTISERTVGDRNIVVAYDDDSAWPFSWYMRLYRNAKYYGDAPNPGRHVRAGRARRRGESRQGRAVHGARLRQAHLSPHLVAGDGLLRPDARASGAPSPTRRSASGSSTSSSSANIATHRTWHSSATWRSGLTRASSTCMCAAIWPARFGIWRSCRWPTESTLNVPVIEPGQVRIRDGAERRTTGAYNGLPLFAPRAVAIGPTGERVIADTGNHRIVVLNRDGEFLRSVWQLLQPDRPGHHPLSRPRRQRGPLAAGDGQFFEPWGVAVDAAQGAIYVADTWNGRIQVFDAAGNFLRKWGAFASTNGELGDPLALFGPRGLAIDLDGNLLVADTGNKRIVRFSPTARRWGRSAAAA
jgi:DNA-binding beta-propeller fold protein YncE